MGAGVLSTRQSRLQAAHEVTAARLRIRAHDERLLTLRAQIAERVRPEAVRELLEQLEGDALAPIAECTTSLVPREIAEGGDAAPEDDLPDDLRRLLDEINGDTGGGRVGR